ncbi:type VI secretion system Vgr family protein [Massilia scottii]|uniref:type VI secretion system Vgr family protein n=1 Tax=Massilia scottii TaxID=3057166 RepID=UPI002796B798|nr:type VI secretion system tip protein TssI/VgrG [Massilia sp. CCM 9029]MDQ1834938.1 type VI secretion system tip protein TssI/VgrG [Massilia sp. CCM 9029]
MSEAPHSLRDLISDRQHDRILRLSFPHDDGPATQLLVNSLDASEALSKPFEYIVELLSDEPNIPLKSLQGKMLCVQLVRKDGSMRYFTGRVFGFSLKTVDGGVSYYEARIGPWYNYLDMRKDNYLFHNTTLYQQTASIFDDYSNVADWDWRVSGADTIMTDACQFGETDSNYLERRWATAGILYWFEHTEHGHKMVLSDDSTSAPAIDGDPEVPFQRHGGSAEEDGICEWSPGRQITQGTLALASYDFKTGRPATTSLPTVQQQGDVLDIESYEYAGAYGFKDSGNAREVAQRQIEALEAGGKQFEGTGNNRHAMPGRWFRLSGHFDTATLGDDAQAREFLITEVHHSASNNYHRKAATPSHYENRLKAIRKIITWRPPRGHNSNDTRIHGIQTAIVVGPAGEEIHTDEYGRVRVQFHWDRAGINDEKSSTWLRVATPWAGANFGMTTIPRVGTEVLVQFMDGNPDRPIITGMVPNVNTMPPWTLPDNKTQSGILTRSTPGGRYDNANALRFEDKKGAEQLWLHAEKDQLTEVEHDEDKWVGNDRRKTIDRDETSHIRRDRTETVHRDETITVHHDRTETVDHDETITVHNNRSERVDHNETISIGNHRDEDVGRNETIHIGQNRTETVGQNERITIGKNRDKDVRNNESDKIGKNWSIKVGRLKKENIGMANLENIGLARMTNIGIAYSLIVGMVRNTAVGVVDLLAVGKSRKVTVGESQEISIGKTETRTIGQSHTTSVGEHLELVCGAAKIVLRSDGGIFLQGTQIHLQGSAQINADGGVVQLNCGAAQAPPAAPEVKKETPSDTTAATGSSLVDCGGPGVVGMDAGLERLMSGEMSPLAVFKELKNLARTAKAVKNGDVGAIADVIGSVAGSAAAVIKGSGKGAGGI